MTEANSQARGCTFGVSTGAGDPWKRFFKKMGKRGEPFHLFCFYTLSLVVLFDC